MLTSNIKNNKTRSRQKAKNKTSFKRGPSLPDVSAVFYYLLGYK